MSVSQQYSVSEMLGKMRDSNQTAFRDFEKCLHWEDANQEILLRNTGVHRQPVLFHIRSYFQPFSSLVKARRNREDGITCDSNNVWSWLGKPQWAVIKADIRKPPVSSRDRIFRGQSSSSLHCRGSRQLPPAHPAPSALQLCSDDFLVLFNYKIFLAPCTLPHCRFIIKALSLLRFSALSGPTQNTQ